MMRAAVLPAPHQPIRIVEVPIPEPGPGEVRLRIRYAALNHRDVWIQKGLYPGIRENVILGSDGVGIVDAIGEGVHHEWLGKSVIINPGLNWGPRQEVQGPDFEILGNPRDGTLAEYVVVPAENIYQYPLHLKEEEAAALPLAGVTAYRALFYRARFQPEDKVLVTGIGGGVAQMAFLMAKAVGAKVYVTSGSKAKLERAQELGADGGVNYKDPDWVQKLIALSGGVDVVVDGASGEGIRKVIDAVHPAGRIVIYGQTAGPIPHLNTAKLFWRQITIAGSTMGSPWDFEDMLQLWSRYQIRPIIDSIYDLENVQAAFERMDKGAQFGKIVVRIGD